MPVNKKTREKKNSFSQLQDAKAWAFPILTLLIVVVMTVLVVIPQLQDAIDARNEIPGLTQRLEKHRAKREQLESLDQIDLENRLLDTEKALPSHKPVKQLLALLSQNAIDNNILIEDFEFSPGSTATDSAILEVGGANLTLGEMADISLDITVSGAREDLLNFMQRLETTNPIFGMQQVTFSLSNVATTQDQSETLRDIGFEVLDIHLNVYYALPPENIGTVSQPLVSVEAFEEGVLAKIRSNYGVEDLQTYETIPSEELFKNGEDNPFEF